MVSRLITVESGTDFHLSIRSYPLYNFPSLRALWNPDTSQRLERQRSQGALNIGRKIQEGDKPSFFEFTEYSAFRSMCSPSDSVFTSLQCVRAEFLCQSSGKKPLKMDTREEQVVPLGWSKQPIRLRGRNQVVGDVEFIRIGGMATIIH